MASSHDNSSLQPYLRRLHALASLAGHRSSS